MLKKIFTLFAILFLISGVTLAAQQSEKNSGDGQNALNAPVFDATKNLTSQEIKSLTEKIRAVEKKHDIKIGIEFLRSINTSNVASAADSLREQHFSGAANGSTLFLVVMSSRDWYISLDPKLNQIVLDPEKIGEQVSAKLHDGNYSGACETFISEIDTRVTYYETNGKAYDPSEKFNFAAMGGAIVIAIFLGRFIRASLIASMSNVQHAAEASDYLKRDSVKITESNDTYLFTNVSRRPKSKSSGGGGGSSGGSGGAGGKF